MPKGYSPQRRAVASGVHAGAARDSNERLYSNQNITMVLKMSALPNRLRFAQLGSRKQKRADSVDIAARGPDHTRRRIDGLN